MADFKKFVFVKAGKTDEQLTALLKSDGDIMSPTGKYYQSIVFVQQTNTIYNRGTQFGFSSADAAKIKTLEDFKTKLENNAETDGSLAKLLADAKSYTDEKAAAAKTELAEGTGIKISTDSTATDGHTKYTISNDLDLVYVAAVAADEEAGTSATTAKINLVDKSDSTVIGSVEVSDVIGNGILKSSSYSKDTGILSLTFNEADGSNDKVVDVDLAAMLDINDISIAEGSADYLEVDLTGGENSDAVFGAKVKKLSEASAAVLYKEGDTIPEGKSVGDVKTAAVTGLVDAADAKVYIDSKTVNLSVSAAGDDYITASVDSTDNKKINVTADVQELTATAGTVGVYNDEGAQTTAPIAATLSGVDKSLVNGKDLGDSVSTFVNGAIAIEAARADANVLASIKALDAEITSTDGTNVQVKVTETDGKVTAVSVATEQYATVTKTATSSTAAAPKTDAAIAVTSGDESKLVKASDLANVAAFAADKVTEETHRIDAKIAALSGDKTSDDSAIATVEVKTSAGEVSDVIVTTTNAGVNRTDDAEDARVLAATTSTGAVTGADIALIKGYVDDKISDNVDWAEL